LGFRLADGSQSLDTVLTSDANGGSVWRKLAFMAPVETVLTTTSAVNNGSGTTVTLPTTSDIFYIMISSNGCGRFWKYAFHYNTVTNNLTAISGKHLGNPGANDPTRTAYNTYSLYGTMG
jgi:hypothetical protein